MNLNNCQVKKKVFPETTAEEIGLVRKQKLSLQFSCERLNVLILGDGNGKVKVVWPRSRAHMSITKLLSY